MRGGSSGRGLRWREQCKNRQDDRTEESEIHAPPRAAAAFAGAPRSLPSDAAPPPGDGAQRNRRGSPQVGFGGRRTEKTAVMACLEAEKQGKREIFGEEGEHEKRGGKAKSVRMGRNVLVESLSLLL